MKYIMFLAFQLVVVFAAANPGKGDTTFIIRPYYLGVSVAYTDFMNSAESGTQFPVDQAFVEQSYFLKFYNSRSVGLMLAFPFLRNWECELGSEFVVTKDWRQRNVLHVIPNTAPPEYYGSSVSRWNHTTSIRLRSMFSYELLRKGKFAWHLAGGSWYDSKGVAGFIGMEGGVKCYYAPTKSTAVQLAANYGVSKGGQYITLRLGVALSGTRNYRAKPDKYYIRTYEDE